MSVQQFALKLITAGGEFCFPPTCVLCQTSLQESSQQFCGHCLDSLELFIPGNRCQRCSAPVGPHLETRQGCVHCKTDPYRFERVFSLGVYDGKFREACLRFKQGQGAPLAHGMTQLLYELVGQQLSQLNIDWIVPVPHHWTDRLLQSHLPPDTIAQQLSKFLKVPVERNILGKVKRTPKQGRLSPSARRQNLRMAFQTRVKTRLDDQHILLVDDVLTTGTTANRASQVLRQAGAASIHVAVIARGIGA